MMRSIYKGPEPFEDGVPIPATLFRPFLQLCITDIGISLKRGHILLMGADLVTLGSRSSIF
jgi:hypothetical protein